MSEVYEFLEKGGVIMIPIALGSVIALAVFLERIWSLQQGRVNPSGLVDEILKLVGRGEMTAARDGCLQSNTPMARLMVAAIDARSLPREELKATLEERGKREVARMERYIEAMGTTASVEPLLGLLGTVVGMIQVFQRVVMTSRQGAVDPGQLANGIWQALITTAAGLSVAIVAFVGYRYLLARTARHALALEEGSLRIVDELAPSAGPGDDEEKP
ncbi:MAG: MotA/TolQ/ExbB proton channel family protein [Polyangia bacterium]